MATFTEKELEYLRGQRLGRLATADSRGAPHVMPLGFRVSADGTAIEVGGRAFGTTKKYRDMQVNPRVAIVIDDLVSVDPWTPRGIEIRGIAELQPPGDWPTGPGQPWVRITPERIIAWGIEPAR